jgi:hypothetical protein
LRRRLRRLTVARISLLLEASVCLAVAKLLVYRVPFRYLASTIREARTHTSDDLGAAIRKEVGWACRAIGKRLTVLRQCLPQAIAAHWMLRRRHLPSTLYLGTRMENGHLSAHAWLCSGEEFIVGGESRPEFTAIAAFGSR